jgi:hypothetical protein
MLADGNVRITFAGEEAQGKGYQTMTATAAQ